MLQGPLDLQKKKIRLKLDLYVLLILGKLFPKDGSKMVNDLIDALSQINAYFLIIAPFGVKFVLDAPLQQTPSVL